MRLILLILLLPVWLALLALLLWQAVIQIVSWVPVLLHNARGIIWCALLAVLLLSGCSTVSDMIHEDHDPIFITESDFQW